VAAGRPCLALRNCRGLCRRTSRHGQEERHRHRARQAVKFAECMRRNGGLGPSPLTPDIDDSALIGYPAVQEYLGSLSIADGEKQTGPPRSRGGRAGAARADQCRRDRWGPPCLGLFCDLVVCDVIPAPLG
jgi:hypothetical protein